MPPQRTRLTSSLELPTYTVAGQQPHDAHQRRCRLVSGPEAENTQDSLRGSACPHRKHSGTSPAFAIGPTAVEEKPKADCRTRKGNKQRNQGPAEALVAFTKTRIQFRNFLYPRNATGAAGRNSNPGHSALAFQPSRKAENLYRKRLFK